MRESLRSHLTFANIVACVALFVALGGTAYAAATIGSSQVIDNSLQSRDLRDGAAVRSQDVVNDNVTGGGLAGSDVRNNTLTSSDVGPRAVGQSELAPAEAFRTDGFLWPAYHSTWSSPGYYRDPFGRVHLKGMVAARPPGLNSRILELPAGYHPSTNMLFFVPAGDVMRRIDIDPSGIVRGNHTDPAQQAWLSLDGVSFRCAPSGTSGCP